METKKAKMSNYSVRAMPSRCSPDSPRFRFPRKTIMNITARKLMLCISIALLLSVSAFGQLRSRTSDKSEPPPISKEIRATAAFAEIIVRRTEVESTLEELLVTYKEEFPKVKTARYELNLLDSELIRFGKLKPSDADKLTIAVGRLIVRRAELATEYWGIANRYNEAHPEAKKAKRKLEIFR